MSQEKSTTLSREPQAAPTKVQGFGPPPLTWALIEEQLAELSGSPNRVAWEVAALRSESAGQPTTLFLRRLFSLAWSLIEEAPETAAPCEEGGMT